MRRTNTIFQKRNKRWRSVYFRLRVKSQKPSVCIDMWLRKKMGSNTVWRSVLGLVFWIIYVFLAGATAELQMVYTPPTGCEPRRSIGACRTIINRIANCKDWLHWVGRGCRNPQTGQWSSNDGGCQYKFKCPFSCQTACERQPQCLWALSKPRGLGKCVKRFTITYEFLQPEYRTKRVLNSIERAHVRWSALLQGQEGWARTPNVSQSMCNGLYTLKPNVLIQDLHVVFDFREIDGLGGLIASAAPCVEWSDGTTAVGVVRIDKEDLMDTMRYDNRLLADVFTHEIGHVLGIGTKWKSRNLINMMNEYTYLYNGTEGLRGFRGVGGSGFPEVEPNGGVASQGKHWSEDTLGGELMSPYLSEFGGNSLSELTGRSLVDVGYKLLDYPRFEKFHVQASRLSQPDGSGRRYVGAFEEDLPDLEVDTILRPIVD